MEDKKFSDLFSKDNDPNEKVFYNAIKKETPAKEEVVVTEELDLEEVTPVKTTTPKSVTKPTTKMETQEQKDIDPLEYETADIPDKKEKPETAKVNAMSFSEGSKKYWDVDSMMITRNIFGQMRKPKVDVALAEKIIPTLPKIKIYIDQHLQKLAAAEAKQDATAVKEIENKLSDLYKSYTIWSLYNKYLTERGK
jgi:hypothetical protein